MESKEGGLFSHDPAIFYDEKSKYYYIYSTDTAPKFREGIGGQIRRSKDLVHFEYIGTALKEVPEEVKELTGVRNIWAPDIIKVGDEYRLYYSASTFGSQNSVIGLAVADNPQGPFIHRGIAVHTTSDSPVNAIDANPVREEETGEYYLVYGSFRGGIRLLHLNAKTGLPDEEGYGKVLACRARKSCDTAIEGPYIHYNKETGYYYLFVSYDSLSNVYNVRVGRSRTLSGPYIDHNGRRMDDMAFPANHVGLKITTGYSLKKGTGFMALGHNSVLETDDGWFMVCHARYEHDPRISTLNIRRMVFDKEGWPAVSPCLYAGESEEVVPKVMLVGSYQRIDFVLDVKRLCEQPSDMEIRADGTVKVGDLTGSWEYDEATGWLLIIIADAVERLRALNASHREEGGSTVALTGHNDAGIGVWAVKHAKNQDQGLVTRLFA